MNAGRGFVAQLTPRRLLPWVLLIPWLGWCTVALTSYKNLSLDMVELVVWGREWQLAYWKHPPLPAWVSAAVEWLSGGSLQTQFLIGPTIALLTMWMVWRLGLLLVGEWHALTSVLVLGGCIYFGPESIRFNHNVIQWPIWVAIAWSALLAFRGSRFGWIAFGLCAALGMYAKYSTAALLASILLLALISPEARGIWKMRGPWVALGIFVVALLPHLLALQRAGYSLLQGLNQKPDASVVLHWYSHLTNPADFLLNQLGATAAAVVLYALFAIKPGDPRMAPRPEVKTSERRFLLAIGLGPLLLTVLANVITGRAFRPDWGAVFYPFLGLLFVVLIPRDCGWSGFRTMMVAWVAVEVALMLGVATYYRRHVDWGSRPSRVVYPGQRLAQRMDTMWGEVGVAEDLPYALGDAWTAGNLAAYSQGSPSLFIDGDTGLSPWIDTSDVARRGGIATWESASESAASSPPPWVSRLTELRPDLAPIASRVQVFPLGWQVDANCEPLWFGAIVIHPLRR